MKRLGFIGLGIMGLPMANRLINAGHEVALHSRSGVPEALIAGGHACPTPKEVAAASEIVFLMLPDTPDVEKVLFGPDGVAGGLAAGSIVVDMSSISPLATKDIARRINDLGCGYIDAPVSGGEVGAKAGTLSIMCGGPKDTFETVKPLLDILGQNVTLVGGNGDGQTCKVANQIIVALSIEAVAEGLLYAEKAGADPAMVRRALLGGFASSKVLEVHGERMIDRNFAPGFRIALHQKDLKNALESAGAMALDLPNLASVQTLFSACAAQHGADLDHSALFLGLESGPSDPAG